MKHLLTFGTLAFVGWIVQMDLRGAYEYRYKFAHDANCLRPGIECRPPTVLLGWSLGILVLALLILNRRVLRTSPEQKRALFKRYYLGYAVALLPAVAVPFTLGFSLLAEPLFGLCGLGLAFASAIEILRK